jgi:hypothetical protein
MVQDGAVLTITKALQRKRQASKMTPLKVDI